MLKIGLISDQNQESIFVLKIFKTLENYNNLDEAYTKFTFSRKNLMTKFTVYYFRMYDVLRNEVDQEKKLSVIEARERACNISINGGNIVMTRDVFCVDSPNNFYSKFSDLISLHRRRIPEV